MIDIYESITLDLDKITDECMRRIAAATDELMDEKLASIGYVKVVRCRDCKHCRRDDSRWYCSELMFDIDWVTSDTAPDSFCAWGERRDA